MACPSAQNLAMSALHPGRILPLLLVCGPLLLLLPAAGCGDDAPEQPQLFELYPDRILAGARTVLRLSGEGFPDATCTLELLASGDHDGPASVALTGVQRLSSRLVLAVLPVPLLPGRYDLQASFRDELPLMLPDALLVEPAAATEDREGPSVWITHPDASLGVRAGSIVQLEIHAWDESGVASIGYEASGLVETTDERQVASGGPAAWTVFPLAIPAELQPLQLFWLVPWARDRRGNFSYSQLATSIVICGDVGGDVPPWPCQN